MERSMAKLCQCNFKCNCKTAFEIRDGLPNPKRKRDKVTGEPKVKTASHYDARLPITPRYRATTNVGAAIKKALGN